MYLNEKQIIEAWEPILKSNGVSEKSIAWMARYCHNHKLFESTNGFATLTGTPGMGSVLAPTSPSGYGSGSSMGGAGGTMNNVFYNGVTGSGDKFPSLLPLAIQVGAQTIAFDLVSVVPMAGPAGMLAYMDYVYTGGDISQRGANNKPDMIKVSLLPIPPTTGFVKGTSYYVRTAAPGALNVFILKYIGKSRIDGFAIFQVKELTDGDSVSIADVFNGASTAYQLYSAAVGGTVIVDTAAMAGKSAVLVKALEDHIPQVSGAGSQDLDNWNDTWAGHSHGDYSAGGYGAQEDSLYPSGMSREVGEKNYYRTMGLQLFSRLVEAQTVQIAMTMTTEQIQDFQKTWGIDVKAAGQTAMIDQLTQHINKNILGRIRALGWTNHCNANKTEQVNLNMHIGQYGYAPSYYGKDDVRVQFPQAITPNAIYTGAPNTFENVGTIQRRIMSSIVKGGAVIANRGRRGPATFGVLNTKLAATIQDISGFTTYPLANNVNQRNGAIYPLGQVAGVTLYTDPNMEWADPRVTLGRKGDDMDPGVKYMPYIMAESIETIAERTMSPKVAVKSRYAIVDAGQQVETQYLTFTVTQDNDINLL